MDYMIIRSRRRSIALEINAKAEILVRAPLRMPQGDITAFVQAHTAWIEQHLQIQRERIARHPVPTAAEEAALRKKAAEILPGRVAYFAALMDVTPAGIKVTGAAKRFGSCSGKNSLCFSYRLMSYPPAAIDYVVVHELAHIRHHDHSAAFYRFVAAVLPDYKQREALLRK